MTKKTVRILSIDGGGIRGLIPAIVLSHLERKTGCRVVDLFDFIAGSSTGGLLALGLVTPDAQGQPRYSASDLKDLYLNQGGRVFHRSFWYRLSSLGQLWGPKYPAHGLEVVLKEYLGQVRLSQTVKPVMVTSYDVQKRVPYFFKSNKAQLDQDRDCFLWEAARATTAAPTYFPPTTLGSRCLIDGGVFANNPALSAWVEAQKLYPSAKRVVIVSLGTGEFVRPLGCSQIRSWGLLQWAQPILDVVFGSVNQVVDYQLNKLFLDQPQADKDLNQAGQALDHRYYRFQVSLRRCSDKLDNVSPQNLRVLSEIALELLSKEAEAIEELARDLDC